MGIARSTHYYKPHEEAEEAKLLKEQIMAEIDKINTEHPCYGQRKIQKALKKLGYNVGRKLVRRNMQQMCICPIYPKPNLSKRNFKEAIVPYLLRNMNIFMPNQVWSIDITYIKRGRSHMYLTAIIDWYSRKIVGWDLSDSLESISVITTVKASVARHGTPGIINSDQGSQFTSNEYKDLLKGLHIRHSMDGKSRWADNIMIERWFRSLKTELIYINEFTSPRMLRTEIGKYIEDYNANRLHEALDYQTPDSVYYSVFSSAAA